MTVAPFPPRPAQPPRRRGAGRAIAALILREMSTSYGRSALGYLWALLEPVAGIMLMALLFSLAFSAPPLGTNFALFYASGILPFLTYLEISQKVAVSLRFSRALLAYPGVTFLDAVLARFAINAVTMVTVALVIYGLLFSIYRINAILDLPAIALGFALCFALALGVGTLNCYLLTAFPLWERAWAVLNRPLFIVSCVFFVYDSVPEPYRGWLWWNPLVHVIGQTRKGFYAGYEGAYLSPLYVLTVSAICFAAGLIALRRYHRDIAPF
ncbi:ABC transporter permease [Sedimentimonas flavescens]|uniref:ABC transporter permease n=1 Tax=Sedimentimonas flavescens TaxID=2851012 RepID=UPI001C49F0EE|nr:ABC transporter permease [Sedimentimonas flavescens]MBW0158231.1 ABC transporter permease [Sedimentimonas flavescens]